MNTMTCKMAKERYLFYMALTWACRICPMLYSVFLAFLSAEVVVTKKIVLGTTIMIAMGLSAISILRQIHLRSTLWIILLGIYVCLQSKLLVILLIISVCNILEELIFSKLMARYKEKWHHMEDVKDALREERYG